jgi:methylglutaconyl-CoA hydratase
MVADSKDLVVVSEANRVVTVMLNRPEVHNALNPALIKALTAVFHELDGRDDVRVIVLTGAGRSFCAGADLEFMRAAANYSPRENVADGQGLFDLMLTIDQCHKPVIGRINGAAVGGGIGLVSSCDIVIAVEWARFGFSEVRLGLVPAVISPFVLARIGISHARKLFLTGERFDARHAQSIGLVNQVVPQEADLDIRIQEQVTQLKIGAPGAQAAAKQLIRHVAFQTRSAVRDYTAELIAELRASSEGQDGMTAFLEKRRPGWLSQGEVDG